MIPPVTVTDEYLAAILFHQKAALDTQTEILAELRLQREQREREQQAAPPIALRELREPAAQTAPEPAPGRRRK